MKKHVLVLMIIIFPIFLFGQSIQNNGVELQYLTWQEAEETLKKFDIVVIPVGAITKEHGPHLQLNNDFLMAEYLAKRILNELEIILMPTVHYGFYPAFLEYPGSVSLKFETFKNVIKDICNSIAGYGIKKFYVLNTGVSTARPLRAAAEELMQESGISMRFTDILKAGDETVKAVETQEGGTHADEIETSMMLYISPETVNMKKAVKDYHKGGRGLTRDPNASGKTYSPTGVWGDATLATREKGEKIVEATVEYIINEIKAFKLE